MTTTTKVFVILVSLFALVFTPMVIQFAARTYNWRQTAEDYRDLAETAYANERNVWAIALSEVDQAELRRKEEHRRLLDAQQQIAELEQKIDEFTQSNADLERKWSSLESTVRTLTAEGEIKTRHNEELSEAKENALDRERTLRANANRLNNRVKELSAELVIVKQELQQRKQEITSISAENEQLRRAMNLGKAGDAMTSTPTPSAESVTPVAASPIRCKVTEVDGQLATISAGSASGVLKNMIMVVVRGKEYICDLQVTSSITPNEAVGRIKLEYGKRIRAGDEAIDAASFTARQ